MRKPGPEPKGLLPPKREKQLGQFCAEVTRLLTKCCKKYDFEIYFSANGPCIEVSDPTASLPEEYEYVATISNVTRQDDPDHEIIEGHIFVWNLAGLIPEDF